VILRDVSTGELLGQLTGHQGSVRSLAFSPDGALIASGSTDQTIIIWNVATGQPVGRPLVGHNLFVEGLAFKPDGSMLASASRDQTIMLWDIAAAQRLGSPLRQHTGWVNSIAFSPDGLSLVSASSDSTLMLWQADLESWRDHACHIANRNLTPDEWTQFIGDSPYQPTCP
jgi:WD40 repeat protein